MKARTIVAIAVMAVLLVASVVSAADTNREGWTLAGVKVLSLVVEETSTELAATGVSQESLRTAIERRLRNADIQLATQEQFVNTPRMPFLHVVVTALPVKLGPGNAPGYEAYVRFAFNHRVHLTRTPNVPTPAETWSVGKLVTKETTAELCGAVFELTASFTTAYNDANPSKQ